MADNVTLPGTGEVVATDDIGGAQFQRIKLVLGENGVNDGDVAAANPLPITAAALTTLAAATALEDTPHASGDRGMVMLAQRRDSDTTDVNADNDYATLKMDEAGRLKVATQPASYVLVTGNITANSQTVFIDCSRGSNVIAHMVATSLVGHNCTFEGSIDSTNGTDGAWFAIQAVRTNANTIELTTSVLTATPAYGWELSVNGLRYVRVRATGHTSGTAAWKFQQAPYATEPVPAAQVSGTQPVSGTVTATGVAGAAAHDAAVSGNPLRIAGRALTANYAAVASGDVADFVVTLVGAQIIKPYAIPELDWQGTGSRTDLTDLAVKAPAAAGIRNYITAVQIQNKSAVPTDVVIKDGATAIHTINCPANMTLPAVVAFPTPLRGTAATAVNVACLTTGANVLINAQGYAAP